MPDKIFPSKLVTERITVSMEFADLLQWGETIQSATVEVWVSSGVDSSPDDITLGPASVLGTTISQRLQMGVPGVIYTLVFKVVGSSGNDYAKYGRLAVLPSQSITPPLIATFLTSRPYPLYSIDEFGETSEIVSGNLITEPMDGYDLTTAILSGSLRPLLQLYVIQPEGYDLTTLITSGELRQLLKSYSMQPEGFDLTTFPNSGSLVVLLIWYQDWPAEGYDLTTAILSGSLV